MTRKCSHLGGACSGQVVNFNCPYIPPYNFCLNTKKIAFLLSKRFKVDKIIMNKYSTITVSK